MLIEPPDKDSKVQREGCGCCNDGKEGEQGGKCETFNIVKILLYSIVDNALTLSCLT